ncbi:hypothetical protein [Celeribacter neptunius]|uniref:Uncharacterized protein n=1 Tax=Celeribacter neptunius TaxID=588602 RepID=A0A1I3TS05_9RHOB|nr:hypothetical protein [Celeribacter neptunius]SFJ73575.1 hypothetical protein SAMN04487991_2852 [Celeribacter neptunius]
MAHDGSDQTGPRDKALSALRHGRKRRVEIALPAEVCSLAFTRDMPVQPVPGNIPSAPFTEARNGKTAGRKIRRTPQAGENRQTHQPLPALSAQEHKTIQNLLDACTDLERQGENQMSQLVDRIGMTMMRSYLDRARDGRGAPSNG